MAASGASGASAEIVAAVNALPGAIAQAMAGVTFAAPAQPAQPQASASTGPRIKPQQQRVIDWLHSDEANLADYRSGVSGNKLAARFLEDTGRTVTGRTINGMRQEGIEL